MTQPVPDLTADEAALALAQAKVDQDHTEDAELAAAEATEAEVKLADSGNTEVWVKPQPFDQGFAFVASDGNRYVFLPGHGPIVLPDTIAAEAVAQAAANGIALMNEDPERASE